MPEDRMAPERIRFAWRGWVKAMGIGAGLLAAQMMINRAPIAPEVALRSWQRLRILMVLLAAAWGGRYLILSSARVRPFWCLLPPFLILNGVRHWPLWSAYSLGVFMQGTLAWIIGLSLLESVLGTLWEDRRADLSTFGKREEALQAGVVKGSRLCFLSALAAGAGVQLLAVDFVFDLMLYSAFAALLVAAFFLTHHAILVRRARNAIRPGLAQVARWAEEALSDPGAPTAGERLAFVDQAGRMLRQSAHSKLCFWDWLPPAGLGAALVFFAMSRY